MKNTNNDTFIKITNTAIYEKLCEINDHVKETNGKVKLNSLFSKASLFLSLIVLSILTGINLVPLF